jgi:hypothetical protein
MHRAVDLRCEFDSTLFLDREPVHVCPKRKRVPWLSTVQPRDDARWSGALDLEAAERGERVANKAGRLVLAKGELRMSMKMPPPSNRVGRDLTYVHPRELSSNSHGGQARVWELYPVCAE